MFLFCMLIILDKFFEEVVNFNIEILIDCLEELVPLFEIGFSVTVDMFVDYQ